MFQIICSCLTVMPLLVSPVFSSEYERVEMLPSNSRLKGQGKPPKFDITMKLMRSALDKLVPIIRKAGPRPSPRHPFGDETTLTLIQAKPLNSPEQSRLTADFFDGVLQNGSYNYQHIDRSTYRYTSRNSPYNNSITVDACKLLRWNFVLPLTGIPNMLLQVLATSENGQATVR